MGVDHPYRLYWLNALAWCIADEKRYAEAEPLFAEALMRREAVLAPDHPDTFNTRHGYVRTLGFLNKFEQAEELALRSRRAAAARYGEDSRITRNFDDALHRLYLAWGKPDEAAKYPALQTPE